MAKYLMINKCLTMLIIYASLWVCHDALDTLNPGDTLNSSSTLISASNNFTLSFIIRSVQGSDTSYLAIMRRKIKPNKAWVANRDTIIPSSSSPVLTLDTNNTLKITYQGGDTFVIFSAPQTNDTSTAVVATILDTGNFVVQQVGSFNGSTVKILWQSFDYPVDTFLPGMKLGVDHRTGHVWSLLSWENAVSSGPYSVEWDTTGHELIVRKNGVVYWSSGILEDGKFKYIFPLTSKKMYNFSIVSNEDEDYLTFTSLHDPNNLEPEWVLFTRGEFYEYGQQVDIIKAQNCDGYNIISGCARRNPPGNCVGSFGDDFEFMKGSFKIMSTENQSRPATWIGTGHDDCKAACWQNCDCLGFDLPFDNQTTGAGCRFWSVDCAFIEDLTGGVGSPSLVLHRSPPTSNSLPPRNHGRRTRKWFWIGTSIAAALLVTGFCILAYRVRRRLSEGISSGTKNAYMLLGFMSSEKRIDNVNGIQIDNGSMRRPDLSVFTYASVLEATANFSEENKLGQGGFGPVYKGRLATTRQVAVKRLSKCSGQGTLEFKNELILISELQHTNLVQLFGFCIHEDEKMLIYEYMPNKSLNYFLFDRVKCARLDWKKRFSIIEGIIQGLLYLHIYSRMKVIHRDLKSSNILLDENFNPKIADFGMARIFGHNEFEANTSRIVGTHGYMAPESVKGTVSAKSDVYSFGVLMLEIISGRKNNSFYNNDAISLVGHAWELWKKDSLLELMDPTLGDSCVRYQFLRCFHIGLLCVESNADHRPTMSDVLYMMTNERMQLRQPKKPAFCAAGEDITNATLSTTVVDGR